MISRSERLWLEGHADRVPQLSGFGRAAKTVATDQLGARPDQMMMDVSSARVLIVEDNETDAKRAEYALCRPEMPIVAKRVETAAEVRAMLSTSAWDIVLCDYSPTALDVGVVLSIVSEFAPQISVVVVTEAVDEEAVVALMRIGIADVVLKHRLADRLSAIVKREIAHAHAGLAREARRHRETGVLTAVNAAENWHQAAETSLKHLGVDLGAGMVVMWEVIPLGAALHPIASWTTPKFSRLLTQLYDSRLRVDETLVGNAILNGEQLLISRLTACNYSGETAVFVQAAVRDGIIGVLCQPLKASGRLFGLSMMFDEETANLKGALEALAEFAGSLEPALVRKLIEHERNLLRHALDAAHCGVLITETAILDHPGPRVVYANDAVGRMSGYSPAELIGKTPRVFQGPDTSRAVLDRVRRALTAAEPISVELTNYRSDGRPFLVEMDISPVRQHGELTHFVAIQTDVTERREKERQRLKDDDTLLTATRKSGADLLAAKDQAEHAKALLQDAIDSISEGFIMFDRDGRFIMCNEKIREHYSGAKEYLIPEQTLEEILRAKMGRGDYVEAVGNEENWLQERLRQFHERAGTNEERLTNGRWMLATDRRMRNGGVAGLRIDITELKEAQAALLRSNEQLDRAQAMAAIGSWELDLTTGRCSWSNQMYTIYGVSRDTYDPTIESLSHAPTAEEVARVKQRIADWTAGIDPGACEKRIVRPNGDVRLLSLEGGGLSDPDGVIRRVAGTLQDITERRKIDRQLAQSQRLDAIGSLTAGMSHDLNNMLAIVIVNLELAMRQTQAGPVIGEVCGEALDGARRCADLIQRLLAFARRQPLRPQQTDANALVTDISRLLRRTLGGNITLKLDLDAALWPVMVDPTQLDAAMLNFATNARDAMTQNGQLHIATRNVILDEDYTTLYPDIRKGEYIQIEFADNGAGIPPEIISHIFDPFFTTKETGKGAGLGLSMAFGFAKQSGGNLTVYSEPGLGATVRLYLPRSNVDQAAHASEPAFSEIGGVESVLVVDDNVKLRRAAVRQLVALGYSVREASDAGSALEILSGEDRVDLVFTDVVMPGAMHGIDLAHEAIRRRPGIAVLLTSGFPGTRGFPDWAADHPYPLLQKPYGRASLARSVRKVLDKV